MKTELSRASEDYLKAIWHEIEESGSATTTGLVRRLGLAASTVSEAVKKLKLQGLVTHDPYGAIGLSSCGYRLALDVIRRHRIVEAYLHEELGYSWDEVHDEAEKLEHVVSARLVAAMHEKLGFPTRDPHGDPIPQADGTLIQLETLPLPAVPENTWVEIARIADNDPDLLRYLEENRLRPGCRARVMKNNPAAALMQLEVAGESVVLGLAAAQAVEVIVDAGLGE